MSDENPAPAKPETALEKVARLRREREEQQALEQQAKAEQEAIDLEHVIEIEAARGAERVKVVRGRWIPGLPTLAVMGTPTEFQVKRFRSRLKGGPDDKGDPVYGAEEMAESTCLYPGKDVFAELCKAMPGFKAECGIHAARLGMGAEDAAGKG